jgi:hypothetical protein
MKGAITAAQKLSESDMEKLDGIAASGKQKRLVEFICFICTIFAQVYLIRRRFVMPPWGKGSFPDLLQALRNLS